VLGVNVEELQLSLVLEVAIPPLKVQSIRKAIKSSKS
jgi:hypothetical protein